MLRLLSVLRAMRVSSVLHVSSLLRVLRAVHLLVTTRKTRPQAVRHLLLLCCLRTSARYPPLVEVDDTNYFQFCHGVLV